jgi:hypothetical protein
MLGLARVVKKTKYEREMADYTTDTVEFIGTYRV